MSARHAVPIKSPSEIEKMRVAGRMAAEVLDLITEHVKVGVTTGELDEICHKHITEVQGGIPAPLNYRGFPKSICTSLNHVVCHGIPGDRALKKKDIINIDVTVIKDGYHGDTSRMYHIGEPTVKGKRICDIALECLNRGIAKVKPGATLGDIGAAIQQYADLNDVRWFVSIAAMVSASCFTKSRKSCTTVAQVKDWYSKPVWCLPLNR